MAYTADFAISLGASRTGFSDLRAQLYDTAGANVGGAISTGFFEHGTGCYSWHYVSFPDGHRGGVKFYRASTSSVIEAIASINPETLENVDAKTSTRGTDSGAATAIGTRVLTGAKTYDQAQRLLLSSQGGKLSGAETGTVTIRDSEDTKNVVVATIDSNHNRTSVTLDLTP